MERLYYTSPTVAPPMNFDKHTLACEMWYILYSEYTQLEAPRHGGVMKGFELSARSQRAWGSSNHHKLSSLPVKTLSPESLPLFQSLHGIATDVTEESVATWIQATSC